MRVSDLRCSIRFTTAPREGPPAKARADRSPLPEIQRNMRPTGTTMTRSFLLLSVLAALLAGCASAKDIAARNEERCQARGLEPKSDKYEDCLRQLENERDARSESRRREALEKPAIPPSNRGY
jgi:hypothetical protein